MNRVLYDQICEKLSLKVPETGGILGSQDGEIKAFFYDVKGSHSEKCYIPDVRSLNRQIVKWSEEGIDFAGIVHSHWEHAELSAQDLRYARQVARTFGKEIFMGVFVYNTRQLYIYNVSEEKVVSM